MVPSQFLGSKIRALSLLIVLSGLLGILLLAPGVFDGLTASRSVSSQTRSLIKPAASPAPPGIRQIALTTKDLVYDPVGQRIYASLPGTAPNGNSLAQIDPYAGTVATPVSVGSEPGRLAISDNSQYIYAGLDGTNSVRRFDLASQTAGLQFPLVTDQSSGPLTVGDIAVMPGQPDTVAISHKGGGAPSSRGVGIYDNGTIRPNRTPRSESTNVIEFASSASTLYAYNNETTESGLRKLAITSNGVTIASTVPGLIIGGDVDMRYANGLVYATSGRVVDPEASTVVGTFQGVGVTAPVLPDPLANRVYFLTGSGSTLTLKAFDLSTFIQTGSLSITGVSGIPGSLIKWADDGLAFRTSGNQVFLFSTADIILSGSTPKPTPVQVAPGITLLPLATSDIVYDPNTQKVYASLPSNAGSFGNSIAAIDPTTGVMNDPVTVGSDPVRLAISDNRQYLYAGLGGASAVRRFDLGSGTAGPFLSLGILPSQGPLFTDDLQVLPGSPNSIAVARRFFNISPRHAGVAVYDDGVVRPVATATHTGSNVIDFSSTAGTLYGYNTESTEQGFRKMSLNGFGVSVSSATGSDLGGDFKYDNGNVYGSNGRVINPQTGATLGTFSGANSPAFVPDASVNRVFFVAIVGGTVSIRAFDQQTFALVDTLNIPSVVGSPAGMIRWGSDGLAMRTTGNGIYFIQTSLVPPAVKTASSTTISSSANPTNLGQNVTFTANVTAAGGSPTGTVQFRDGGVSIGSPQPLVSGMASVSTTSLAAGLRTITAEYSGDANFLVSAATLAGGQTVVPALSINDVSTTEGDFGTKSLLFTVTLSGAGNQTVTVNYASANGTATAGSDYVATSGTVTFSPSDSLTKTIAVTLNSDVNFEPDETFVVNLSNASNANISKAQGTATIVNDDVQGGFISFGQTFSANENTGFINVTVNRSNDTSRAVTVDYATTDTGAPSNCVTMTGLASSRCDFNTVLGTLAFAAGETQKTFTVLINRDSYTENTEQFGLALSNPTNGAVVSTGATTTGFILNSTAGSPPNVIDDVPTFVRQHYRDFLNRQADASGLAFWTNQITSCGSDVQCNEVRRIDVSASFFLSIEFQQTGYLVERFYKAAYGDGTGLSTFGSNHQLAIPIVRLNEFLADTQRIGRGVIVLQPGWEQVLETNKQAYALEFVQTARFTAANTFPTTMSPAEFVDKLNQSAGNVLSESERATAINLFGGAVDTSNNNARAQALRQVADDTDLFNAEYNRAFVLAQYFGYLRRNPNDAPDSDYTGFDFWLTKLNQFNGSYINAEMVKAFMSSIEYRQRFGP